MSASAPGSGAGSRILVVDDDAWIVRMVTTVLEQRGYQVDIAYDGEQALEKLTAHPPDLLITDVMMPKLDGWRLVKRLRSTPALAFVPVIFLTALGEDKDRIKGFRLGADDYLPKPFRFEELELRVARVLKNRGQETRARASLAAEHESGPGLRGDLAQFGVSSLVLLIEMERKTGTLVVSRGGEHSVPGAPPETVNVWVRGGRVVRARGAAEGRETTRNAESVYEILGWTDGGFEFSSGKVEHADEMQASTTQLLLEGARRLDEARKL